MNSLQRFFDANYIKVSQLARAAGIPKTTLYKYTSGGGDVWNMSVYTFAKLAHALGMTTDELIAELGALDDGDRTAD